MVDLNSFFLKMLEQKCENMEYFYLQPFFEENRIGQDCVTNAKLLYREFSLKNIKIDFDSSGIMTINSNCICFDFGRQRVQIEAFFTIKNGANSLHEFLNFYFEFDKTILAIVRIEQEKIIIGGVKSPYIYLSDIDNYNPEYVVANIIKGGVNELKELEKEINVKIDKFNSDLYTQALLICEKR